MLILMAVATVMECVLLLLLLIIAVVNPWTVRLLYPDKDEKKVILDSRLMQTIYVEGNSAL